MRQEFQEEHNEDAIDIIRNTVHTLQSSLPKLVVDLQALKTSALTQGSITKPIAYLEHGEVDYLQYITQLKQYIDNLPEPLTTELRTFVPPLSVFLYHELRQRQNKEVYIEFLDKIVKHKILDSLEEVNNQQYFNTKHVICLSRYTYEHILDFIAQQQWLSVLSVINQNFVFDIKEEAPPKTRSQSPQTSLSKACHNVDIGQGTSSFSFVKTLKITNTDSILCIKFSHDNNILLASSSKSVIYKWDLAGTTEPYSSSHPSSSSPAQTQIKLFYDSEFSFEECQSDRSYVELRGHTGPVYSVDIHRSGRHALSASYDGSIILWDLITNGMLHKYESHTRWPVYYVKFSPVASYFCSASHDTTAKSWQTSNREALRMFAGHDGPVTRADFHPNGSYVITASEDMSCRMWDVASGNCVRVISTTAHISTISISPNGKMVMCALRSGDILLYDIASSKIVRQYGTSTARLTNGYHGKHAHKLQDKVVTCSLFLHDNTLATGDTHGNVLLWDTRLHSKLHSRPLKQIHVAGRATELTCNKAGLLMVGVL